MTYDEKLVEKAAQALFDKMEHLDPTEGGVAGWDGISDRLRDFYRTSAEAVLIATDASGTHWIAPREATEAMLRLAEIADSEWVLARDAYLTERR